MPSTRREFRLPDEMKNLLGISRIYVEGKVLFVENAKVEPITCLYTGELISTFDALRQTLTEKDEFDEKWIDKFLRLFADVWRKSEEDNSSSTSNIDGLIMQLELTDELKQEEIVSSYVFNSETDNLSIALNFEYSNKKITSPIEYTWPNTIDTLTKELQRKKVSPEHITMLCDVADNEADKILKWRIDRKAEKENNQKSGSQPRRLLSLADEQCQELFVNQYMEPYAAVIINEHIETLNLNHTRFKNWICKAYYQQEGSVPSSESVTNVLNILKARAEFDGNGTAFACRIWYRRNRNGYNDSNGYFL
jgi:hypothetical protein